MWYGVCVVVGRCKIWRKDGNGVGLVIRPGWLTAGGSSSVLLYSPPEGEPADAGTF